MHSRINACIAQIHMRSSCAHGCSDGSAAAITRPRRRLRAHHCPRRLGGPVPSRAPRLGPRDRAGRGAPVGRRSRGRGAAGARRHRARARVSAPPHGPPPGGGVHPVRRPPARPDRAPSRRRRRRPGDRLLLRRLRLRGRPLPLDARCAAADLPPAPGPRQHAARDDGPARPRDAARGAGPAGAARSTARRRAGAGPARALHRGRTRAPPRGSARPATPTSAPRCAPCTPSRRANGRWPISPPRRRCRARPSPGASPSSSASGRSPT